MFIKLTDTQKNELQKYLIPDCATNLNEGTISEIETNDFWDLDWYIIDHAYSEQETTCDSDYPYSVQVLCKEQWFEIDVIPEKLYRAVLDLR